MSDSNLSLTSDDENEVSKEIIGKLYNNRYFCLKYLGRGTFSRVWLVNELETNQFYAMKVVFSEYIEDGEHELEMANLLDNKDNNESRVIKLINSFKENDQIYIINELMGIPLVDLLDEEEDIKTNLIKKMIKDVLLGLKELHKKNIVHNDLKLENVMSNIYTTKIKNIMKWFSDLNINDQIQTEIEKKLPENYSNFEKNKRKKVKRNIKHSVIKNISIQLGEKLKEYNRLINNRDIKEIVDIDEIDESELNDKYYDSKDLNIETMIVKIIDLGNSEHTDKLTQDYIQIRQYRPPENIINNIYGLKSDIWALGCMIYEIFTTEYLFDIEDTYKDDIEKDRAYLYEMYSILGKMPRNMALDCEFSTDYFDNKGRILKFKNVDYTSLEKLLQNYDIEDDKLCDLLKHMFDYHPKTRYSCDQCLIHEWFN
tara:strand:+ start:4998 stop:6278 length:1281 start_codon:yes stop_codon:yes gene_type:complete